MLKILQARLQQYMNRELPYLKLDLKKTEDEKKKKDRRMRDQIANIHWIIEKAR